MDNNKIDEAELTKNIKTLVIKGRYEDALRELEDIDLRKIRQPSILCLAGEVYMGLGKYDQAERVLLRAYERQPGTRRTLDLLTTLYIDKGEYAEAEYYYKEFIGIASKDLHRYILRYRLDKAKGERLSVLIDTLEKLKDYEYIEEWAYELASLYDKSGETQKCIRECDEIVLWFGHGEYVDKAVELKCRLTGQPLPKRAEDADIALSKTAEDPGKISDRPAEEAARTAAGREAAVAPDKSAEKPSEEDEDGELTAAEQAALDAAIAGLNQETFSEEDQPYANAIDLSIVESGMKAERAKHSRETLADILNTAEIELQKAAEAKKLAEAAEKPEEAPAAEDTISEEPEEAPAAENIISEEPAETPAAENVSEVLFSEEPEAEKAPEEAFKEEGEAAEEAQNTAEEAPEEEENGRKEKNDIIHLFGSLFGKRKKKAQQEEPELREIVTGDKAGEAEVEAAALGIAAAAAAEGKAVEYEDAAAEEALNEAAEEIAAAAEKPEEEEEEAAEEIVEETAEVAVEEAVAGETEAAGEVLEEAIEGAVPEYEEAAEEEPEIAEKPEPRKFDSDSFEDDDETEDEPSDEISALFDEAERTLQTEAEKEAAAETVEEVPEAVEAEAEEAEAEEIIEAAAEEEAVEEAPEAVEAEVPEAAEAEEEPVEEPVEESGEETVEEQDETIEPENAAEADDDEDEIIDEDDEDEIIEAFTSETADLADSALIGELFAMAAGEPEKSAPVEDSVQDPEEEDIVWDAENASSDHGKEVSDEDEDDDEISDDIKASDTVMNIFGSVSSVKSIQSQLVKTFTKFESPELDTMDLLAPYDINFIVTGSDMSVKSQIAIGIAKALNTYGVCDKNKLVRADATVLNGRDFEGIFDKLAGGCLVIEGADELNERSIGVLSSYVNKEDQKVAIVLELDEEHMTEIFTKYPEIRSKFLNIIHIGKYNENELVQLAKGYAKNKGYDISMSGETKLKRLLKERMRDGASVNYEDIMEITEEAISSLEKRNMRNLFMTVLENKYEDAAMFVLQSEDFDNINIPD